MEHITGSLVEFWLLELDVVSWGNKWEPPEMSNEQVEYWENMAEWVLEMPVDGTLNVDIYVCVTDLTISMTHYLFLKIPIPRMAEVWPRWFCSDHPHLEHRGVNHRNFRSHHAVLHLDLNDSSDQGQALHPGICSLLASLLKLREEAVCFSLCKLPLCVLARCQCSVWFGKVRLSLA